jgi:hypothetical protein
MKTHTTTAAAQSLGLHVGTVRRLCKAHGIGTLLNATTRVLSDKDFAKLKGLARKPGNPNWQA